MRLAAQTTVLAGGEAYSPFSFDPTLWTLTVGTDIIPLARSGSDYTVTAKLASSGNTLVATAPTTPIRLTPVHPRQLRDRYLATVSLVSQDALMPIYGSPITGVTLIRTSADMDEGVYQLLWDSTARTLTFSLYNSYQSRTPAGFAGTPVAVPPSPAWAELQLPLLTSGQGNFATVAVDTTLLPVGNASSTITLAPAEMTDSLIADLTILAAGELERQVGAYFEPHLLATPYARAVTYTPPATPLDLTPAPVTLTPEITPAVPYERHGYDTDTSNTLKAPTTVPIRLRPRIMHIYQLAGGIGQSVGADWQLSLANSNFRTGLVAMQGRIGGNLGGGGSLSAAAPMFAPSSIPAYWQFSGWFGVGDVDTPLRLQISDYIAKRAAILVLVRAGLARYPGIGGLGMNVEGVSENQSLSGGDFGVYSNLAQRYFIETNDIPGQSTALASLKNSVLGRARGLAFMGS